MKVLSLLQPWATLVVIGAKKIETRTWNTKYRGPVLIHASKRKIPELLKLQCTWSFDAAFHSLGGTMSPGVKIDFARDLPFGAIIGMAEIVDSRPTLSFTGFEVDFKRYPPGVTEKHWTERHLGDYSEGRFGWLLSNPVLFKTGIPAKGSLGLWEYNDQIPGEIIKHGPITTEKMARDVWVASCQVIEPLKAEVNQRGNSGQEAINKLNKFLSS